MRHLTLFKPLFLLLLLPPVTASDVDWDALSFHQISIDQGLSESRVTALFHEPGGYLWLGTQDGLNRFDGNDFKVYRHDTDNPFSLPDNNIQALNRDSQQRLLVCTDNGLVRFDPKTGGFISIWDKLCEDVLPLADGSLYLATEEALIKIDAEGRSSPIPFEGDLRTKPNTLYMERTGNLFIGCVDGLYKLVPQGNLCTPVSLSDTKVSVISLCDDGKGGVWAGTTTGLYHVPSAGPPQLYRHEPESPNSLADDAVYALMLAEDGNLWIGTDHEGLDIFEPETGIFHHFTEKTTNFSLVGKGVWSIYPDPRGGVWLGTFTGGLNRCDQRLQFHSIVKSDAPNSLSDNTVLSIFRDRQQTLWVGTDRGLNRQRKGEKGFDHIKVVSDAQNQEAITHITADAKGQLWLGMWGGGLHRLRADGESFDHFYAGINGSGLSNNTVIITEPCPNGDLWVGTNKGLNLWSDQAQRFIQVPVAEDQISVFVLLREKTGQLWIGSRTGLYYYDPATRALRVFAHDKNGPSDEKITSFHQDVEDENLLWIATAHGLNRYDRRSDQFTVFDKRHGLPNNAIYGVEEDARNRLWISTSKGLAVADKAFKHCRVFDKRDGLPTSEFNTNAAYQDARGLIYFGSISGLVYMDPSKLRSKETPLPVKITEFLLNNKPMLPVALDPNSPLPVVVDHAEKLTLDHTQRMIGFSFAAMDFTAPWHCRYRYRLMGFDSDWIETDPDNRRATYTNLPAGDYSFHVKVMAAEGIWSTVPTKIDLKILAAPWLTWWAKLLYGLAAALILGGYLYMERQKLSHERKIARQQRELAEKDRATAERLRELDKLKDQFLANTSHELRTPLNGIIGLADGLLAEHNPLPEQHRADLSMIVSSGRRLSTLINDIMDFSLLKRGDLALYPGPVNLAALGKMIMALNRPLLRGKNLELCCDLPEALKPVHADEARLGQILQNLIGNAIKFTKSGQVVLWAKALDGDRIEIGVRDSGIGISPEAQESIFLAFQQADGGVAREYGGTGLGLAISRRLVQLHDSEILLKSELGVGSDFSFILPASREAMPQEGIHETVSRVLNDPAPVQALVASHETEPASAAAGPATNTGKVPSSWTLDKSLFSILVVDDEPINRRVLVNHLAPKGYAVFEAEDGEQGLQLLNGKPPDLILLDIMMPGLSGFEVCERLRNRYSMDELPVIFLTARNRVDDMVTAFEAGANDFLAKPVAREELLVRVNTHLQLLDYTRVLEHKVVERSRALITSQKMASIGVLATGLAHEINNPNNFINGGVQLIEELIDEVEAEPGLFDHDSKEWQELLQDMRSQVGMIRDGSRRIDEVVKQLSSFTSRSAKTRQRMDILANLRTMIRLVQAQFHEVRLEEPREGSSFFNCSPNEIHQVFLSLLVNACEAVVRRHQQNTDHEGWVRIQHLEHPDRLELRFEDNGDGIQAEHLDHLFEAFFTTKRGSTTAGLGLYTSWEIVSGYGGRIEVASNPGQGSVFKVLLPLR